VRRWDHKEEALGPLFLCLGFSVWVARCGVCPVLVGAGLLGRRTVVVGRNAVPGHYMWLVHGLADPSPQRVIAEHNALDIPGPGHTSRCSASYEKCWLRLLPIRFSSNGKSGRFLLCHDMVFIFHYTRRLAGE